MITHETGVMRVEQWPLVSIQHIQVHVSKC